MKDCVLAATAAAFIVGVSGPALAATHCVKPGGGSGCTATISPAVAAAAPGDTIYVARGTYNEDVVITKSIYLIGEQREHTIIDAAGLPNGVDADGFGPPGLSHVVVSGFTIENATTEGVLVSNASQVSITDTHVTHNDRGLVNGACTTFVPP